MLTRQMIVQQEQLRLREVCGGAEPVAPPGRTRYMMRLRLLIGRELVVVGMRVARIDTRATDAVRIATGAAPVQGAQ